MYRYFVGKVKRPCNPKLPSTPDPFSMHSLFTLAPFHSAVLSYPPPPPLVPPEFISVYEGKAGKCKLIAMPDYLILSLYVVFFWFSWLFSEARSIGRFR